MYIHKKSLHVSIQKCFFCWIVHLGIRWKWNRSINIYHRLSIERAVGRRTWTQDFFIMLQPITPLRCPHRPKISFLGIIATDINNLWNRNNLWVQLWAISCYIFWSESYQANPNVFLSLCFLRYWSEIGQQLGQLRQDGQDRRRGLWQLLASDQSRPWRRFYRCLKLDLTPKWLLMTFLSRCFFPENRKVGNFFSLNTICEFFKY